MKSYFSFSFSDRIPFLHEHECENDDVTSREVSFVHGAVILECYPNGLPTWN
jgi:hypothetical protein